MPEVEDKITGKTIAKFEYTPEGEAAAKKLVAENSGYEIKDAMMRSEQMYAGGGKTGYDVPMYKKGGKVKK